MHYKSPVVAIIGIGRGKSVLFMLPALCSTGVTVVVVLLAQVVLVTPESAVRKAFGNFINRQQSIGRLDRIVINKCHVILDLVGGWRSRILALRNLVIIETQLEEDAVVKLVESLKQKHAGGQVIVYYDTVKKTIRLAEVLECVCFHRNVGSSKKKSELVKQLTKGRQQVFTATNVLGLGINAPIIRAVVHVGTIRKMRHYAQESGRAGRDGRKNKRGVVYKQDFGEDVKEEIQGFIVGRGCIRKIINGAIDGN
ncbi:P-loop containing nucleoside triphosphate hydrolase protein [Mytilinidion resinicola]|uniref:DNA 3'-5' helicase n=1 Tax=Mytilinidion resinicola TaxID=574789 RepID=A0A6A6Y868_9PEZI|nr:P-loop containing nucleoside triphosphate hydrolase protein [Mytilinidion resinicola]KAF2805012.1 P-loop containing nucleoside triphosphate hydrolase protein [Mytilinidion resinicola]